MVYLLFSYPVRANETLAMHRLIGPLAIVLTLCIAGCDGAGPEDADSGPPFAMTLGAPVSTAIEGHASFADGASVEDELLLTFPLPQFGVTLTAIQLFSEDADGTVHDVSFVYIADDTIAPGTYDVNAFLSPCDAMTSTTCEPGMLFAGSLFTGHYARQTADSLYTYGLNRGAVTVDEATDDVVRGTFDVSASVEVAVAKADLEAYVDALRSHSPDDDGHWSDFPEPPPSDVRLLAEPMPVTGSFAATPGEVSDWMSRFGWLMGGAPMGFGQP